MQQYLCVARNISSREKYVLTRISSLYLDKVFMNCGIQQRKYAEETAFNTL